MRNAILAGIAGLVIGAILGVFALAPMVGGGAGKGAATDGSAGSGRGYTGMQIQGLSPEAAKALGQEKAHGVLVRDVALGGPADRAGLMRGDLIVKFAGQDIDTFTRLVQAAGKLTAGQTVALTVRRDGGEQALSMRAGAWPATRQINQSVFARVPEVGLTFVALTEEVRKNFSLRWGVEGVVVSKVEPIEGRKVVLKTGEVIVQVNQRPVWLPRQVAEEIGKAKKAGRAAVLLLVEGAEPGRNGYRYTLLPIR